MSPLGDPPLFIGFLKGVDFFWTARNLALPTALLVGALLVTYWLLDLWLYRKDGAPHAPRTDGPRFEVEGAFNLLLIAAVIGAVLMSGLWKSGVEFDVLGTHLVLEKVLRDTLLVGLALLSLKLTPKAIREHNAFHWGPIIEVAKIFAGIFLTIIPVLAMLGAGPLRRARRSGRPRRRSFRTFRATPSCSGSPVCCRPSSTTRRPISSSSTSPAAMRRG